jgi:hypothetical protein
MTTQFSTIYTSFQEYRNKTFSLERISWLYYFREGVRSVTILFKKYICEIGSRGNQLILYNGI